MHILHNILFYCILFDPMHISILSFSLVICYSCFLHLPPFPPTSVFSFVLKRQISVIFLSFPSSLHSPLPNPPPSIPPPSPPAHQSWNIIIHIRIHIHTHTYACTHRIIHRIFGLWVALYIHIYIFNLVLAWNSRSRRP